MDAWFLEHPHSGVITMCVYLCMDKGFTINIKRVRRLMRLMGLMAIYLLIRLIDDFMVALGKREPVHWE